MRSPTPEPGCRRGAIETVRLHGKLEFASSDPGAWIPGRSSTPSVGRRPADAGGESGAAQGTQAHLHHDHMVGADGGRGGVRRREAIVEVGDVVDRNREAIVDVAEAGAGLVG